MKRKVPHFQEVFPDHTVTGTFHENFLIQIRFYQLRFTQIIHNHVNFYVKFTFSTITTEPNSTFENFGAFTKHLGIRGKNSQISNLKQIIIGTVVETDTAAGI